MTTRELRKELIIFIDEEDCSMDCKFMKINYGTDVETGFICIMDNRRPLKNPAFGTILRCQKCKDLFKQEIK